MLGVNAEAVETSAQAEWVGARRVQDWEPPQPATPVLLLTDNLGTSLSFPALQFPCLEKENTGEKV